MPQKPPVRPYNCQVAPGQKPFQSGRPTATTHSTEPVHQATEGRTYRVRDKDWVMLWGDGLTYTEALKLKEQVVGSGRSKTARVEDMEIQPPDWWVETNGGQKDAPPAPVVDAPTITGRTYGIENGELQQITADGTIIRIPLGSELVLHKGSSTMVQELPFKVSQGDVVQARPVDPQLIAARAAAREAVADQLRAQRSAHKLVYRDVTVKASVPRTQPAPRDKTAATGPVFVRLGAAPSAPEPRKEDQPLSPLVVATQTDGTEAPADVVMDDDLKNLVPDLGGGPTADDIELARRQREADVRNRSA